MGKFREFSKGEVYGNLTVIRDLGIFMKSGTKTKKHYVECQCNCKDKNIVVVDAAHLTNGHTTSCGCLNAPNLVGDKYGRLTVLEKATTLCNKETIYWKCLCECQLNKPEKERQYTYVSTNNLKRGYVQSCGCLQRELMSQRTSRFNQFDIENYPWGVGWTSNTNEIFIFDKADYDKIKDYCWSKAIDKNKKYVTLVAFNKKSSGKVNMAYIVTGEKFMDHKNHDTLDNRKENLRPSTNRENNINRVVQKNNTSGITGVFWDKTHKKWCVRINIERGEKTTVGYFENFDDAVRARLLAEQKYYGEFAPQKHLYAKYGIVADNENVAA